MKPLNLIGNRYGKLVVIKRNLSITTKNSYWDCMCDCGNTKTVRGQHLKVGNVLSCGCLAPIVSSAVHSEHGLYKTRAYSIWRGMMDRCYKKSTDSYYLYGARGITVCDRWKTSVQNFYADMGEPLPRMTIDRIDSYKGYSPSNCRWATNKEQANNKRNNVRIEFNGVHKTITMWAESVGLPKTAVRARIRLGWEIKDALTFPIMERIKYKSRKKAGKNANC